MANVVLFLIAAMTVLLVMSLFAVITMSPADAVGTGLPVPDSAVPAGQPGDSGAPAWDGVAQIVTSNGPYPLNAPSGPPWGRAARPPDPW
jgi:hypothetical protein